MTEPQARRLLQQERPRQRERETDREARDRGFEQPRAEASRVDRAGFVVRSGLELARRGQQDAREHQPIREREQRQEHQLLRDQAARRPEEHSARLEPTAPLEAHANTSDRDDRRHRERTVGVAQGVDRSADVQRDADERHGADDTHQTVVDPRHECRRDRPEREE
jgi:hypothetical protein